MNFNIQRCTHRLLTAVACLSRARKVGTFRQLGSHSSVWCYVLVMKREPVGRQASRTHLPGADEPRALDQLARAHEAYANHAWRDAYEAYRAADAADSLAG